MTTIEYYWRPGCPFCMMLTPRIRALDVEVVEYNIWEDAEAAARVRAAANGNETVPTVIIGERALVNPSIKEVRAALGPDAPPEKPPLLSRIFGGKSS